MRRLGQNRHGEHLNVEFAAIELTRAKGREAASFQREKTKAIRSKKSGGSTEWHERLNKSADAGG
jgi:hypothetical protein